MTLCTMVDQVNSDEQAQECGILLEKLQWLISTPRTYTVLLNKVFGAQDSAQKGIAKHCLYLLSNSIAMVVAMGD